MKKEIKGRVCKTCRVFKVKADFPYERYGIGQMKTVCKECETKRERGPEWIEERRKARRLRYERDREILVKRDSSVRETVNGRAIQLLSQARVRARDRGLEFSLERDRIREILRKGKCEVTGIPFDFKPHPVSFYNPFAPSIDKIDHKGGYTHDNTQIVIWAYNSGKGQMDEGFYRGLIVYMANVFLSGGPDAA